MKNTIIFTSIIVLVILLVNSGCGEKRSVQNEQVKTPEQQSLENYQSIEKPPFNKYRTNEKTEIKKDNISIDEIVQSKQEYKNLVTDSTKIPIEILDVNLNAVTALLTSNSAAGISPENSNISYVNISRDIKKQKDRFLAYKITEYEVIEIIKKCNPPNISVDMPISKLCKNIGNYSENFNKIYRVFGLNIIHSMDDYTEAAKLKDLINYIYKDILIKL